MNASTQTDERGPEPGGSSPIPTRLAAVIGSPVAHSRSPAIHNAAFAACGLKWIYAAFEVAKGRVPQAVRGMRALEGFDGMSVTSPHKLTVANEVDRLSPEAMALGVVNTVVREADGRLRGECTDGAGLVASLAESDFDPSGRRCMILGAGGSARSIARSLARARAGEVVVVNRTRANAISTCAFAGPVGRVGEPAEVMAMDLVVNAIPVGRTGPSGGGDGDAVDESPAVDEGRASLIDVSLLSATQLVVDLNYYPLVTPLLEAADAQGARTANGLAMLVHQAALQFTLWTGCEAPLKAMWSAVES